MEKKKPNFSITIIYKEETSDSELDCLLLDEILGKDWCDKSETHKTIVINNLEADWQGQAEPISINRIIAHLEDLKNKGCNHVEIMNHSDHRGYEICGLDIHRSTDEEVKNDEERIEKTEKRRREKKMETLKAELKKLEGQ